MEQIVSKLRVAFNAGRTKTKLWRRQQLHGLIRMLSERENEFTDALNQDLRKCKYESVVAEIEPVKNSAALALNSLDEWMKPESIPKNMLTISDSAYVVHEPYGVSLVIGAWNFPISVTLLPVIGAVAAGNAVLIKPSEISVNVSHAFARWIPEYLDTEAVHVVEGGASETQALLAQKFDYIFYTGGTRIGRVIYEAAAKHLTPCTLELGGKSATFVDRGVSLEMVAHRLMWGKTMNCGQICIAPDYVLCSEDIQEELIAKCAEVLKEYFGEDQSKSADYGRIVNEAHFKRLSALLQQTKGQVKYGGGSDASSKYMQTTLITANEDDATMQEEIFGPILPILTVKNEQEAIQFINKRSRPLVIYLFTDRRQIIEAFEQQTSSGALVVNDTVVQNSMEDLPFGGVGDSGFGVYHGRHSFEAFSHKKPVLCKSSSLEFANKGVRYPPYTEKKLGWAHWLLRVPVREGSFFGRMLGLSGGPPPPPQAAPASAPPRADEKDIEKR